MTEQFPGGVPFGLREIAKNIQWWLDWNKSDRDKEPHLTTDDGTAIMALPVASWPNRGALALWVKVNQEGADEIERLRAALKPFATLSIHPQAPDDGLVVVTNLNGGIIDTGPNSRVCVKDIRNAAAIFNQQKEDSK